VTNLTTGYERVLDEAAFESTYTDMFALMKNQGLTNFERTTGYRYEEFTEELPTCQRCGAVAIVEVCGKTSDMCNMQHLHREFDGYVLRDMGVGQDDYLEFEFCVNCGQIQGEFPKRIHGALVTRETKGYPYE
jgi:hypothetical protein